MYSSVVLAKWGMLSEQKRKMLMTERREEERPRNGRGNRYANKQRAHTSYVGRLVLGGKGD
jgi:hypothetical protein